MKPARIALALLSAAGLGPALPARAQGGEAATSAAAPLAVGETFTIASRVLGETRRVNVYRPPAWGEAPDAPRPVLYMPDGGLAEDFLHVAGLLQVSVGNGTVRPFLLVGIENTERRRDLTGPTRVARDSTIAPRVGGSAAFRAFLREELMPAVRTRYPTTGETAIMGESLAGLFVVETLLLEPGLFDTFIAFDPSLWWNGGALLQEAPARLRAGSTGRRRLWLASSGEAELARLAHEFAGTLQAGAPANLAWHHEPMPAETHGTIYHPAALVALRRLFPPPPGD